MTRAILLTGATGFLGGHLLRALVERGEPVVIALRRASSLNSIAEVAAGLPVWNVEEPIGDLLVRHQVDVVIHAATAYGRGGESLAAVATSNVTMPLTLLEAARAAGVTAFINSDTFSAKATDLPDELDGYVLTKKHFRQVAELAARAGPTRLSHIVIEHMYGEGDRPTKFVPSLVRALLEGVESFALTPGGQSRDFVHVSDVASAYLAVVDGVRAGKRIPAVEAGTGQAHTLRQLVELIHRQTDSRTALQFGALPYRKGELMESRANLEPLRALGWSPRISLEEGVQRTVEAAKRELTRAKP